MTEVAPHSEAFQEIAETFDLIDDWEERYRYVIELGKQLPPMPDALKTADTKVDGCASQVWLSPELREESGERRLYFLGDSDAHIVRGLIAVLRALLSGQPVRNIADSDPAAALSAIGLSGHLSSQRANGLNAMIVRIKALATAGAEG